MHGETASEEITKEKARQILEGYYTTESVADIFDNNKGFRLRTPYSDIWTQGDNGTMPMAGFYGTVG